ncbi:hypothetical protein D3C77_660920 [compost metagenome]
MLDAADGGAQLLDGENTTFGDLVADGLSRRLQDGDGVVGHHQNFGHDLGVKGNQHVAVSLNEYVTYTTPTPQGCQLALRGGCRGRCRRRVPGNLGD